MNIQFFKRFSYPVLIYSRVVDYMNFRIYEQVQMFLSELTSTTNDLTSWNMFVINKPTVLLVRKMTSIIKR